MSMTHALRMCRLIPLTLLLLAAGKVRAQEIVDITPPLVTKLFPAAGTVVKSLAQIEVTFSEDVTAVQASDLLINGNPAKDVRAVPGGPYIFTFQPQPAGNVQVSWASSQEITDTADNPNHFAGGNWSYTVDPQISFGDLVITEILAVSGGVGGLADEDADQEDWIEIFNRGKTAVNLENWGLSDDPKDPGQWTFPARTLGPGEYLIVFASGKDRKPSSSTGRPHTNFKLADLGEPIGLYTPESPRVQVSGFATYPEQRAGASYGADASGNLRYFATPTPGKANGISTVQGLCAPVHVNVSRGHFSSPFDLILTCQTPGVIFRYTTNGSEPTLDSPIFPSSLTVSKTLLFRAAAFRENYLPSKVVTHTYLFNLSAGLRSMPIVSIVTSSNNLYGKTGIIGINGGRYNADGTWSANPGATNDFHNPSKHGIAWERATSVEWIKSADNSGFQVDCGIRVQGSDYQRPRLQKTSKFSFRLYFRGDYGPGRLDYPLFPFTSTHRFDQLVLRAGFNEQTNPFIRDELHRRLSGDMGDINSHGNMAVVLLNGVVYTSSPYYNPCERVHEEFMQEHLGGGPEWDVVGPSFGTTAGVPGVIDGDRANFGTMVSFIRTQPMINPTNYLEAARRLDLTNFVDYCILNTYAAMGDWPANNWRAGRERSTNGIWRFIVWDAEWGMGIYSRAITLNSFTLTGGGPDDSGLGSVGSSEIAQIHAGLKSNYEYRLLWADRVQKHLFNGGALTGGNISNRFAQLKQDLIGVIPTMDTVILQWASTNRSVRYINQLTNQGLFASSNAPVLSKFGGAVPPGFKLTITNLQGGDIYYTTDGSDPRLRFTNTASLSAFTYAQPLLLTSNLTIKARSLSGTNWSALTEAPFTVASMGVPLRITEVMYDPAGGSAYEFIELQNVAGSSVDLSGMYFSGLSFVFKEGASLGAGARLVLASGSDTNAWMGRYPGVPVAGWFSGKLNNGGDRLALLDRKGETITAVTYGNDGSWPAVGGLGGKSIEVIDPLGNPDDPANWQASQHSNGSPGAANALPENPSILINEVMAENLTAVNNEGSHPDWIELYNPRTNSVNLAGWSLSDDANPRKFVFPANASIAAKGYLVLWCDSNKMLTPGLHTDFGLDRDGETIGLFDSSTNRIDAVTFGAQLTDFSLGRVNGEWVLTLPRPNAPNEAAPVESTANLAINEWLANPLPGGSDWIELYNSATNLPVSLQGIYLANSNTVQQIQAPSFVAPGGYFVVYADGQTGPNHLDLRLALAGDQIVLADGTAAEIQRVRFGAQASGISQGRFPDASTNIVTFRGSSSPGAANYTNAYTGPVFNEIAARNRTVGVGALVSDFLEMYNPGTNSFDLSGMSLSVNKPDPGQWIFPLGAIVPAQGFLVIACDGSRPASFTPGAFNVKDSLDGDSGGAYLFNAQGQLMNMVEYGPQVEDMPIGLNGTSWVLLTASTPGASNAAPAQLGVAGALRVNEWQANPVTGSDWFELYNSGDLPVDLSTTSLTDDPSIAGRAQFRPAPLSFIAAKGFTKFIADGHPSEGRNHVNFSLDSAGDALALYSVSGTTFTLVDSAAWGAQLAGGSEGSFPDGSDTIVSFPFSPTPGAPNVAVAVDTDHDGIPDAAELAMGLDPNNPADAKQDTDHDGFTNLQEFLAGTNYTDKDSVFAVDRVEISSGIVLTFTAAAGHSYSLLSSDSLGAANWKKVADLPVQSVGGSVSLRDSQPGASARFYRLVTPAQP